LVSNVLSLQIKRAVNATDIRTTTSCEGPAYYVLFNIQCPPSTIVKATFGRQDLKTCPGTYGIGSLQMANTTCSLDVTAQLKAKCVNQTTCVGTLNTPNFTDPCPGIYKYLTIQHTCVKVTTTTSCQGPAYYVPFNVQCPSSTIIKATFGRQDLKTCPGSYGIGSLQLANTTCSLDVTSQLKAKCVNQTTCVGSLNTPNFTDPCPGIYKYLTIEHNCDVIPTATGPGYPYGQGPGGYSGSRDYLYYLAYGKDWDKIVYGPNGYPGKK